MSTSIPSSDQVRERLSQLGHAQIKELSASTGAPFTTLWKIRSGETADPRLETVRAIWPELVGVNGAPPIEPPAASAAQQEAA